MLVLSSEDEAVGEVADVGRSREPTMKSDYSSI